MTTERRFLDDIVKRLGDVDKSRRRQPDFRLRRFGDGQQQATLPKEERRFGERGQLPQREQFFQPFQFPQRQDTGLSARVTQPFKEPEPAVFPLSVEQAKGILSGIKPAKEPPISLEGFTTIYYRAKEWEPLHRGILKPSEELPAVNLDDARLREVRDAYIELFGTGKLIESGLVKVTPAHTAKLLYPEISREDFTTLDWALVGLDALIWGYPIGSLGVKTVIKPIAGKITEARLQSAFLKSDFYQAVPEGLRNTAFERDIYAAWKLHAKGETQAAQNAWTGVKRAFYAGEYGRGQQPAPPPAPAPTPQPIPRGTQTGALAFGGVPSKQPWQMTTVEYRPYKVSLLTPEQQAKWTQPERVSGVKTNVENQWDAEHKQLVQQALSEGKPVPPEVLADYPDLKPTVTPPTVEGVAMPSEVQREAIVRANALLESNPIPPSTLKSISTPVGEVLVRTDAEGQILVVAQLLPREGQLTASNIVLAEGKGLAGGRAVKEVIDYLQKNNIALPPRGEMSPEALRLIDKLEVSPEAPRAIPEAVTPVAPPSTPQAQQVERIQQQGRTAPESVPPEEAKVSHTEKAAPDGPKQPPPPTRPPTVGKPEEPSEILKDILAKQVEGERPDQTVMRLYGAAARNVKRQTNIDIQKGNQKLKEQGIGVTKRGQLVPREKDKPKLLELYNALHNPSKVASGEIAVPEGFDEIYTELRGLADWDTAARLDFDPNAATIEDWFFRGWKPPEGMFGEAQKGALGTKPRALRMPRVNATFEEMIDLGFEPLFRNPYQQWGYRHNLGEIYREQMVLVSHLKSLGDDLIRPDMGGALPAGWKIPKIGPAFEGKPFAAVDGDGKPGVMFTRRWAVPTKTANLLESMFGKRPDIGTLAVFGKTIDPLTIIDWVAFVPKRAKLLLSLFQQQDFLTRSGGGSWGRAIDALISGKPVTAATAALRFPKTALDIIHANLSPTKRLSLSEQLDNTTALIEGRPGINLKGISEAGLSVMDETIWATEMDKLMSTVAENTGIWGKIKDAGSSLVDLESAMRRGLFQGVYPASMITEIKNNIATMMVKQHPTATDAQINGYIAKEVNKKYSTIPPEQSIIQNTFVRELLRRITFSFGESEALLRQATGMFHGPNKRFWIKENIGQIIFVLVVANIIHFLSTGEPLPKERYTPIAEDNWGPLPFGYNTKFASPTIPWQGRGGTELTVDLVGQMDTAYRVLDPASFISARASVPIRAMVNQVSGTDFYGAPIDDVGPGGITSRLTQLIYDMFSPIGVGGISTAALRDAIPGEIIPRGEERLGLLGLGLQATGVNIRAERTRDLLDRHASESGLFKRDGTLVQNWNDLEPHQKDKVIDDMTLVEELEIRSEISAERGYPGAQGYATLLKLEQQRIKRGEALVTEFNDELMDSRTFRNEVTKLKLEIASRKSQVDEDFQLFQDNQELPEDPNKRALVEYFTLFDNAKRESGVIDWDRLDRLEMQLKAKWTQEQRSYVDDNTGITEWGPLMSEYIEAGELLSPYWEVPEGSAQAEKRRQMRRSSPELDAALVKWYGYKPISTIPGFTPPLRVPTRTPSRELVPAGGDREINLRRF